MLAFLRKFRRKNIEESKMKKVILYALGEIFLVVIGILIAVQLNNWNNQRKLEQVESVSLTRLYEDLRSDFYRFDFLDSAMNHHSNLCDSVSNLITTQTSVEDRLHLIKIHAIQVFLLEANTITYEEMTNTGRLYSLSDRRLRRLITLYYRQIKKWDTYSEANSNRVRHMIEDSNLRDYWVIQSKLRNGEQVTPRDFPWLNQQQSDELKAIDHLMYLSSSAQRENLGNYEIVKGIRQSLLTALETR
ncbi:MAG: DUF6090 family protein [Cyclobacteriaceae bacterium]